MYPRLHAGCGDTVRSDHDNTMCRVLQYGCGAELELHLKGQRVCEQAERGFRGENSLGGDSMDKTLKYASSSRAWVQASESGAHCEEYEVGEAGKGLLRTL